MTDLKPQHIAIGLVGFILICIVGMYCSSSSETNTRKADRHAVNANTAHQESIVHEKEAEVLAEEGRAIEKERIQATKTYQKSKPGKVDRSKYEKVTKEPVVISGDDLDARERKLLARLKELYPQF